MRPNYFKQISKLLSRPAHIYSTLRGRLFFLSTHYLMKFPIFKNKKVKLGQNVRLQGLFVLMAEKPNAQITIGDHSIIYEDAKIEAYGNGQIEIGTHSIIGRAQIFSKTKIKIGSHVVTSWNVFIQDYDAHPIDAQARRQQIEMITEQFLPYFGSRPDEEKVNDLPSSMAAEEISIGNNVWIGANTSILKGAQIGDDCVIAAHAVVLKGHYPKGSILAGVPAKIVKSLTPT